MTEGSYLSIDVLIEQAAAFAESTNVPTTYSDQDSSADQVGKPDARFSRNAVDRPQKRQELEPKSFVKESGQPSGDQSGDLHGNSKQADSQADSQADLQRPVLSTPHMVTHVNKKISH